MNWPSGSYDWAKFPTKILTTDLADQIDPNLEDQKTTWCSNLQAHALLLNPCRRFGLLEKLSI